MAGRGKEPFLVWVMTNVKMINIALKKKKKNPSTLANIKAYHILNIFISNISKNK
jgi:hypothetical protein